MEQEEPFKRVFQTSNQNQNQNWRLQDNNTRARGTLGSEQQKKNMFKAEEHLDLLEDQIKDTYQTLVSSIKKMRTLKK